MVNLFQPQCCAQPDIYEVIDCAKVCTNIPPRPTASFLFDEFILLNTSIYNATGLQEVNWKLYKRNTLIYDFGFHDVNDIVPQLANGSTYGAFDLGIMNVDILAFIASLPNFTVIPNEKYVITISARDSFGHINTNTPNTYTFYS